MFFIRQINDNDCGFTAVKILLANIFKKEEYLYISEDETHEAYSLLELVSIAKEYGVTLTGVEVEDEDSLYELSYPFLAVIHYEENSSHLVYVYKYKKKSVEFYDPSLGRKVMKKEKFLSLWDNTALIVESKEEVITLSKRKEDIPISKSVIALLFQITSLILFALGVSFIRENGYIFIPIICFALFAISQIVLEKYLTHLMREVDNLYLDKLDNIPDNPKEFLIRLSNYKKTLFVTPIKLIGDLFTALFLTLVMIINDYHTGIVALLVILLVIFDYVFIKPYLNKKKDDIILDEKSIYLSKDKEEFSEKMMNLNNKAYEYTNASRFIRYVFILIIALSVISSMLLSHVVSVPYVLIYLAFGVVIFDKGESTISYFDSKEQKKVDYYKLNNYLNPKNDCSDDGKQ